MVAKRRWERTNAPGPTSYKTAEAVDKTRTRNSDALISQSKEGNFWDSVIAKGKKSPGVGKYNAHTSFDKIYRPARKY